MALRLRVLFCLERIGGLDKIGRYVYLIVRSSAYLLHSAAMVGVPSMTPGVVKAVRPPALRAWWAQQASADPNS